MRHFAALTMLPAVAPAALAFLLIAGLAASLEPARAGQPLEPYAWEGRPLLIFGPSLDDKQLRKQAALFKAETAAMRERDMPLILAGGDETQVDGVAAPFSAEALRRSYGVPEGAFAVLLIGKDTGVKLRSGRVVRPEAVFELIDAMPMRQDEMRAEHGDWDN